MTRTCMIFGTLLLLLLQQSAQAEKTLTLQNFEADELARTGFELKENSSIQIEATGIQLGRRGDLSAYAWILNAKSRQPVWVMEEGETDRVPDKERFLRTTQTKLELQAGRYEMYYFAGDGYSAGFTWIDSGNHHGKTLRNLHRLGRFLHGYSKQGNADQDDIEDALEQNCFVTLQASVDLPSFEPTGHIENTLYHFTKLGDEEFTRTQLHLKKDMDLGIYALVEYVEDWRHPADYGWIVNSNTGKRVWTIDWKDTEPAGGAEKNRVYQETVHLPRGEYVLTYGTDDSHSYEKFNAAPPYDPINWGITITAAQNRDSFHAEEAPGRGEALIDLTGVRNNGFAQQAFELKKDSKLHLYAIGEYDYGAHEFSDYAWIEDAKKGDVIWEMKRRNTEHAGGADKNRLFDGIVELPRGKYIAFYSSDGSHSYRHWNSAAPFDGQAWGLGVYATEGMKKRDLKLISEDVLTDSDVLVRIVHVGDDAIRSEPFELKKQANIKVYALGEGMNGRMYDYGYIENSDTGKIVWRMTWRRTHPAGGAKKNRMLRETINLPAGHYEVFYETDDSHSFPDWNAARPRDPRNWGITLRMAGKK